MFDPDHASWQQQVHQQRYCSYCYLFGRLVVSDTDRAIHFVVLFLVQGWAQGRMTKYQKLKQHNLEVDNDPTLPYSIYRPQNIAIVMAYFSIGLTGSFLSTPLNVYLVEHLNAEPQMQNTIGILQTLPWSMKVVFGFLSDACPIGGLHRKPYLIIGALLYSLSFMMYSWLGIHNVVYLATSIFLGTVGLIVMDVMVDTMCVQRSKFEPEESKGQMQASCYSIRFAGSLIGAIMGATLCNKDSWGWGLTYFEVSFLNGVIPFLLVIPCLFTYVSTLPTRVHMSNHGCFQI